jgi:hypothetical protein
LRLAELLAISASGALIAFAARGIGETVQSGHSSYLFRVAAGYRVPAYFDPVQGAETTDAYSLGEEVTVKCRYVDRHGKEWLWIEGTINGVDSPWLPASDVVPSLPHPSGPPPHC